MYLLSTTRRFIALKCERAPRAHVASNRALASPQLTFQFAMDQQRLYQDFINELNYQHHNQPEQHHAIIEALLPYLRENNSIHKTQKKYEEELKEAARLQTITTDELVIATQYSSSLERKLKNRDEEIKDLKDRIKEYERMHAILFIKIDELKRHHFKEPTQRTLDFSFSSIKEEL